MGEFLTEVSRTILKQLGGNHFLAMTGARVITCTDKSILFNLPRNMSHADRFEVILDADDTYTVKFLSTRRAEPIIYKSSGLYFDMLQGEFTRITGMHTKLF